MIESYIVLFLVLVMFYRILFVFILRSIFVFWKYNNIIVLGVKLLERERFVKRVFERVIIRFEFGIYLSELYRRRGFVL